MTRKEKEAADAVGGMLIIIGLACMLLCLPFMLYGFFFHRSQVVNSLRISENARHVFDAGSIWLTVKGYYYNFIGTIILSGIGLFVMSVIWAAFAEYRGVTTAPLFGAGSVLGYVFLGFCALILLGMALAAGIATGVAAIGVWVDPATNRLVFPHDGVSRSFEDLITFRWVLGGLAMAEVPLDEIASMTREAGKTVLVQGDFGSCRIEFSSKLKRDDCFNAIRAAGKVVGISPQVRWW